jgi:hypothetical protein
MKSLPLFGTYHHPPGTWTHLNRKSPALCLRNKEGNRTKTNNPNPSNIKKPTPPSAMTPCAFTIDKACPVNAPFP